MEIERRTVLQAGGILAVGGLVAACSSGSGDAAVASEAPAGSRRLPARHRHPPPRAAPGVAQVSDIPVGGGVIIDEPAVVITQPAEGEVKAFTAICTHQGCLVSEVVDNEIICPCHGSRFSAVDGSVTSGPAPPPG